MTNGVHVATWAHPSLRPAFPDALSAMGLSLRFWSAPISCPMQEIWAAHQSAQEELLREISETRRSCDAPGSPDCSALPAA